MAHLERLRQKRVVVLPDLYIDALVALPAWSEAERSMAAIAARGGGNLPVGPIRFYPGGNAANLGLALARLGAQVELVAKTDALGLHLMRKAAQGTGLGMAHVEADATASATIALESEGANVMLSHAGPVADFGPDQVTPGAWEAIEGADAIAVVNWSQNRLGTKLLEAVARRMPDTFLYIDTGDPRHRPDAARLLESPAWTSIDAWGLNENEVHAFGGPGDPVATARALATRLGTRLDLHTRSMAASVTADEAIEVAADATPAKRLTGAGDAWNAGNLAGHLLALPTEERLALAHTTATRHVTGGLQLV